MTTHITPQYVQRTLAKHMLADGFDLVCDLRKSRGTWLHDAKSKRDFLDMFTCFASMPLGYNHPELTSASFTKKLLPAAINKISNSDLYSVEMAEAIASFDKHALPDYLPHLFLIEGGTLAVENCLKAAFDWKVRRNFAKGYKNEVGHQVLHFRHAFHGRSGYTLSLTNTADPRKYQYFPRFNWPRVDSPALSFPLTAANIAAAQAAEEASLTQIHSAIAERGDDIACLIIEPIQGEGGDRHFRPEFFRALREICSANDILLIFDEVQTGLGLTGKMWAHEHYGVQPDLVAFGKKTQVCGVMGGKRLDEIKNNVFVEGSRINSTWGGNIVDIMRMGKIVEIIDRERLLKHVEKMGAHLQKNLHALAQECSEVSNVRGLGLMCAVDFPTEEERNRVRQACFNHGMIILPCGTHSLRFRPPLTVTAKELDLATEVLRDSIKGHSRKAVAYDNHP